MARSFGQGQASGWRWRCLVQEPCPAAPLPTLDRGRQGPGAPFPGAKQQKKHEAAATRDPSPPWVLNSLCFFVSLQLLNFPLEAAQVSDCSLLPSWSLLLLSLYFANFSHACSPDPGNSWTRQLMRQGTKKMQSFRRAEASHLFLAVLATWWIISGMTPPSWCLTCTLVKEAENQNTVTLLLSWQLYPHPPCHQPQAVRGEQRWAPSTRGTSPASGEEENATALLLQALRPSWHRPFPFSAFTPAKPSSWDWEHDTTPRLHPSAQSRL